MRLSKHTTVVAYLALFVALGGSAYAATGGNFILGHANSAGQTTSLKNTGSGAALKLTTNKRTTPPLAVSDNAKIANLNADLLDGLSAGAFQSKIDKIVVGNVSDNTASAGGVGPWSFHLVCKKLAHSSGGSATFKITGPGTAGGAHTVADGVQAGNTFVAAPASIGTGYNTIADTNQQVSATLFLQSGSTTAEVEFLLVDAAVDATAPQNCDVTGAATLLGSRS